MKRLICAAALAVGLMAAFAADDPSDGWAAKFYKGLEAAGDVTFEPQGYYGKRNAIVLKWSDGMPKFGAAKRYVRVKGSADWTVTAQASVDEGGKAGAAIEFFDKEGRSLALLEGATQSPRDWAPLSWTFSAPARTESAEVHLLSLDKAQVRANPAVRATGTPVAFSTW